VTFEERGVGAPAALHSWFYPGETYGVEFKYPRPELQHAAQSDYTSPAAAASAAIPPTTTEQVTTAPATEQTEPGTSAIVPEQEEVIVVQASPEESTDGADSNNNDSAQADVPDTLPQTAGNFAAIPLIGIVLLSGGFAALRFATIAG
jgi:hypothetical protein